MTLDYETFGAALVALILLSGVSLVAVLILARRVERSDGEVRYLRTELYALQDDLGAEVELLEQRIDDRDTDTAVGFRMTAQGNLCPHKAREERAKLFQKPEPITFHVPASGEPTADPVLANGHQHAAPFSSHLAAARLARRTSVEKLADDVHELRSTLLDMTQTPPELTEDQAAAVIALSAALGKAEKLLAPSEDRA